MLPISLTEQLQHELSGCVGNKEIAMMTQPIRTFETLASEPMTGTIAAPKLALSFDERRRLEARARYARAEAVSTAIVDAGFWIVGKIKALVSAYKAEMALRASEDQLRRMSDRELADLGLSRAEIEFAVRRVAEGVAPVIAAPATSAAAANQNLRNAA
jgi:uncharacterized protein YjiS (DUF1127 family)